jgi:lipoate-protein ligase A
MVETWRIVDTGLASAARNIALSRALLESRHADEIPSTLHFSRFAPSVLLGSGQSAPQELDAAWCAEHGIAVQRRISGGRATYVDERQLGWELYLHRRDVGDASMQAVAARVTHAAAAALSALGVDARYRARDEIEVDGQPVAIAAHAADGSAVIVQCVVFMDPDAASMRCALRNLEPADRAIGLKHALRRQPGVTRVKSNLVEAFESEFDVEFRDGDLGLAEQARYENALREIDTRDWVDVVSAPASDMRLLQAVRTVGGGTLRAALKYETSMRTIRQVWFSGDIPSAAPRRMLSDLEATLRDVPMSRLARQVEAFFAGRPRFGGGATPADFVAVVRLAVGEPLAA